MIRLDAKLVLGTCRIMSSLMTTLSAYENEGFLAGHAEVGLDADAYFVILEMVKKLKDHFIELKLPVSTKKSEDLLGRLNLFTPSSTRQGCYEIRPPNSTFLIRDWDALYQMVATELGDRRVVVLDIRFDKDISELVDEETLAKLPKAREDLEESLSCLQSGHYTASVFHLMRVLEYGVSVLAKKLKVNIDTKNSNWYQLIIHINKAITSLSSATVGAKAKKQKLAAASASLDTVRIAWRNDVMHPKSNYTKEEAVLINSHVLGFIKSLASIV